jgi:hypothetical protein
MDKPNFRELRTGEVGRISLLGTWVNKLPVTAPSSSGWHHFDIVANLPEKNASCWQGGTSRLTEENVARASGRSERRRCK